MMMNTAEMSSHARTMGASPLVSALHEHPSHARDREDLLGDDETTEQRADVEGHDRDERDQRVAEPVLEHDTLRRGTPFASAVRM